ncbi:MAG: hypothetical protein KC657_31115, partial [Myxococcales bacterium]|nr:hypothetical protein [Myxococcales bacterium]
MAPPSSVATSAPAHTANPAWPRACRRAPDPRRSPTLLRRKTARPTRAYKLSMPKIKSLPRSAPAGVEQIATRRALVTPRTARLATTAHRGAALRHPTRAHSPAEAPQPGNDTCNENRRHPSGQKRVPSKAALLRGSPKDAPPRATPRVSMTPSEQVVKPGSAGPPQPLRNVSPSMARSRQTPEKTKPAMSKKSTASKPTDAAPETPEVDDELEAETEADDVVPTAGAATLEDDFDDDAEVEAVVVDEDDDDRKPPSAKQKKDEEGGGDSMLARYFREMATHSVMGPDEELSTAIDVENAEVEQWCAALAYLPAAEHILETLTRFLPTGDDALDLPQLAELHKLVKTYKKQRNKLTREQEKKWRSHCEALARAIRLADSDRLWIAGCVEAARSLGEPDSPDDLEDEGIAIAPPPASTASVPQLAVTAGYKKYVEQIHAATEECKRVKNRFVKANLRLVVSIARRYNRGRLPLIDLIQEGNIGLMKAENKFEYRRGYK